MKTEIEVISLVGKTLKYDYGENSYKVNFISDTELHWECLEGDEKGRQASETYVVQYIKNDILFISWIEADGLGVSQVLDFGHEQVKSYLKIDKDIIPLSGTIEELLP